MDITKKFLAVLLCFLLSFTLVFTACSQENAENGDNSIEENNEENSNEGDKNDQAESTPPGSFPIVKKKETLKVLVAGNTLVEDFNTNEFTKWYEEKTNVHIEWEVGPTKNGQEKLNLVLASGDYPDIIMNFGVSPAQQMIYGEQGVFLRLNDLIEKYGVETKKLFEKYPIAETVVTAPDGNIYSLPNMSQCFHCSMSTKMWIYKPWLDKLGLQMPTTTEEFYEVLKAFKEKDPNGNGKPDEIPLSGAASGWYPNVEGFLMNAFIFNNVGAPSIMMNDGKVDVPFNKTEWKQGLEYLRKLYSEGLVAPESFTQDSDQLKQMGENPDIPILGAVPSGYMGMFTAVYGPSGRWLDYVTVPPLRGPNGVQYANYNPFSDTFSGKLVITNAAKNPEVALRWADAFYNEEVFMRQKYGREGHEWKRAEPGQLGINGEEAIWEEIAPYGQIQNIHWAQSAPILETSEFRLGLYSKDPPEKSMEHILYRETLKYDLFKVKDELVVPPVFFTDEQSSEIADLQKTISDYVKEMTTRFITGDLDLVNEWDGYVQNLESMNLKRYLEIYQEAYDAKYKK